MRPKHGLLPAGLLFVLCAWCAYSDPIESIVLGERDEYPTAGRLGLLIDPTARLGADEAAVSAFRPVRAAVANLGLTSAAVWMRFVLENPGRDAERAYIVHEYPVTDSVSFFFRPLSGKEQAAFGEIRSGDSVARAADGGLILSRHDVFRVRVEAGGRTECLLRFASTAGMSLPVRVFSEQGLAAKNLLEYTLYGMLGGFLVLAVASFLAISARLREGTSFWFAVYFVFFGLHAALRAGFVRLALDGLGRELYFLNNPLNAVFVSLLFFSGTKFFRLFLDVKGRSTGLDRIMLGLQWAALLYMPLTLFPNPVLPLLSLLVFALGPMFSSGLSFWFWVKRSPTAGYFAFGWLSAHLVAVYDVARINGLLPYPPLGEWMIPISLVIALACFGAAIIVRSTRDQLLARKDALTNLANRRQFDESLQTEWNRMLRLKAPLTLIMADVDHFKLYNDDHGHRAGDACLAAIAFALKRIARRAGDLVARYGGEEFVMLLPNMSAENALRLAEGARASVEKLYDERAGNGLRRKVTVSFGVASLVPDETGEPGSLVGSADQALYAAKLAGRNRVDFSPSGRSCARR